MQLTFQDETKKGKSAKCWLVQTSFGEFEAAAQLISGSFLGTHLS